MAARAKVYRPGKKSKPKPDGRRGRNPKNEIRTREVPQTEPDDSDRFFVIEKFLDKRFNQEQNQHEYLVRWLNYPPEWDSWEPEIELERNSRDLLDTFNNIKREEDEYNQTHCICHKPYRFDEGGMIQCQCCLVWFHFKCLNLNMEEANSLECYFCDPCRQLNPSLKNRSKKDKRVSFY